MTGFAEWPAETLADMLIRAVEHDPEAFTNPERLRSAFAVIYPTLDGAQLEALMLPVRLGVPAQLERGESVTAASAGLQGAGWDPATASKYATAYALALGLPVVTTTYPGPEPAATQTQTQWANQAPPFPSAQPSMAQAPTAQPSTTGQQFPLSTPSVGGQNPNRKWMFAGGAVVVVAAAILIPVLTLGGGKGGGGTPLNTSSSRSNNGGSNTSSTNTHSSTPAVVGCVNGCTPDQAALANHMPNMVTGCEPPIDNPTISANTGASTAIECQINPGVAQNGDASPVGFFALGYPSSVPVPTTFATQVSCDNSASPTPTPWFLASDTNETNPIGVQGCLAFDNKSWVVWTYTQQNIEIAASGVGLSTGDLDNWFGDLKDENLTAR